MLVGLVVNRVVVHADCTVAVTESGDGTEGAFFDAQGHADLVPPGSFAGTLCGGDVLGVVCRGSDHGVQLGEPGENLGVQDHTGPGTGGGSNHLKAGKLNTINLT